MKITQAHRDHMLARIEAFAAPAGGIAFYAAEYERGNFHHREQVNDLHKRFCWDMLGLAGLTPWICDTLYPYADDTHILTALKSILPAVVRKY